MEVRVHLDRGNRWIEEKIREGAQQRGGARSRDHSKHTPYPDHFTNTHVEAAHTLKTHLYNPLPSLPLWRKELETREGGKEEVEAAL